MVDEDVSHELRPGLVDPEEQCVTAPQADLGGQNVSSKTGLTPPERLIINAHSTVKHITMSPSSNRIPASVADSVWETV